MSFWCVPSVSSYETMLANAKERTFIVLKGALFETSFHNDRLFIYRSNTTCFLKKNSFGITVWVKSGKFLRYSRGRQKGSTDTLKSVGSRAVGLQIALPVLCGPTGLTLGCNLYREGWRGCWQLPQPCPERVHLPCLPYSLLSPLSISSLLFLPLTSQVNNMLGSWP